MSSKILKAGSRIALGACVGLLLASSGHATTTPFTNPFTGGGQSTVYVSFTATVTGTLQAYFVSSNGTGFTDGMGIYTGGAPDQSSSLSSVTWSSYTNKTASFGTALFGSGIQVTAGQTYYFVEKVATVSGYSTTCNNSLGVQTYYVWSNESANCNANVSYSNPIQSGYNAMAYKTTYNTNGAILSGNSGNGTTGYIAAGNYTYVGFNDWLGGQSNNYNDYSFLFNVTACTQGTQGCTSGSAPEPGSVALVGVALLGAAGARRRVLKTRTIAA